MEIKRDTYLGQLTARMHNGMIKVITGMRRCGKSYLLFNIFRNYLLSHGTAPDHIISVNLEDRRNKALRDPDALLSHIDGLVKDNGQYYILLDEVQMVPEFEDVLNSFLHVGNADVYVTGSNAKFLSKDVITEFRGRGDEINIRPLSFREFLSVRGNGSREALLNEYLTFGGLPQAVLMSDETAKRQYLADLFTHTYLSDIKERHNIQRDGDLEELIDIVASNVGGLTNPTKLANTFASVKHSGISGETIKTYLEYLQDSFLIEKATRYDIKGKRYIATPSKYYFTDLGLRNARLNFRQTEFTHLMENCIYNELRLRGFCVDVGQVYAFSRNEDGAQKRTALEVDFVCNLGYRRYYVQSAYALPTREKVVQEERPLMKINDSFAKYIIVGGSTPTYQTEEGIVIMGICDFLANENSLPRN